MISPAAIEEGVLTLLAHSDQHAHLVALKVAESKFFATTTNKVIAQTCLDFIAKYSAPPRQALELLLENDLKRGEQGKLIKQSLDLLQKNISQIQPEFILEQLDRFLETKKLSLSIEQSLELLQEGNLEKAKEAIYKVSSIQTNSPGLWMRDAKQALNFLDYEEQGEYFSSGIDLLDLKGIRPERKTFMFLIAAAKKGKSWWLIEVGKRGLQHHKKVLHVTLEISERKTARRYIQSIFSLTKNEAMQVQVPYFIKDGNGNTSIEFREFTRESIISKKKELQNKIDAWVSCPQWIIKEFPTSTLSVEQLSMYIDSLERQKGFKPDLLIIDYADLMKIDSESLRIDTGRLYRELRGLAVSKDMALVSATQGNRESEDAKLVNKKNVSEDWSKIGTADAVLTYSQTPEERKIGLARIFTAAVREAEDQFVTMISQNYTIGQFCLDSIMMNSDLSNYVQGL